MVKKTKIIILISAIFIVLIAVFIKLSKSADHSTSEVPQVPDTTAAAVSQETEPESTDMASDETIGEFPVSGKSVNDFVIGPYEIVMEAKGLLNNDELEDVALVLQEKKDSTARRPTLVLLKQPDGSYKRYATSWSAIGAAYINGDYQHYDDENITIDSARNLNINTYGSGPVGNRDLKYRFVNHKLILVEMETYNMGAGGHTGVVYDFLKGKVKITEVNTMKDDMPSTTTEDKIKSKKVHLFETTDPESIQLF